MPNRTKCIILVSVTHAPPVLEGMRLITPPVTSICISTSRSCHKTRKAQRVTWVSLQALQSRLHGNEDPINGCQIGTKHPTSHAKQDQLHPIHFSDATRHKTRHASCIHHPITSTATLVTSAVGVALPVPIPSTWPHLAPTSTLTHTAGHDAAQEGALAEMAPDLQCQHAPDRQILTPRTHLLVDRFSHLAPTCLSKGKARNDIGQ
jgi:hypothetical protein